VSTRTQLLVLVALLGAWALVFALRTPAERRTPRPAASAAARPAAKPQHPSSSGLRLELLDAPRPPYPREVRNIFGTPPPPPPPPPPAKLPPVQAAPQVTAPAPPPPDPFVEEAKQFRFVGFLRSAGALTAFISRGQEIHSLQTGAVLHSRYRIQSISEEDVVLASLQGDKQVRLPIAAASAAPASQTPTPARGLGPPAGPGLGAAR
jgi:hypothetical protein